MVLQKETKLYEDDNGRTVIYIPTSVRNDSQFPFKTSTIVSITIDNDKLVIKEVKQ